MKLVHFLTQNLLSHAEMFENVLEGFIGCDGAACDVAKMGEGDTKVLGKEVTTKLEVKTFLNTGKGFMSTEKGFVMTGMSDNGAAFLPVVEMCGIIDNFFKLGDACAVFS